MINYRNLLLVDDDLDDHEFFLEAIHDIDHTINCQCVLDGEEALNILKEQSNTLPDLIILDTNMPKRNGRQLLVDLKSDSKLQDIPVVMYSTFFSDKDSDELKKLGAVSYLVKPSNFADFRNALSEILTTC